MTLVHELALGVFSIDSRFVNANGVPFQIF